MNNIEKYFAGERIQCLVGIGISIISICLSIYLFSTEKAILKGIAYPFTIIAIILLTICIGVVWRTSKDILRVNNYSKFEPSKLKSDELPRMEKVMTNFKLIKRIEIILLVIGLVLIVVFWKNPLLNGIAIGLMVQASIMFVFDTFAEKRGHNYLKYLQTK